LTWWVSRRRPSWAAVVSPPPSPPPPPLPRSHPPSPPPPPLPPLPPPRFPLPAAAAAAAAAAAPAAAAAAAAAAVAAAATTTILFIAFAPLPVSSEGHPCVPLCRVTFGLRAQPNLPGGRPGPPFSTNPGNELRGSRGLLVAMATEPSPNPLGQMPIPYPSVYFAYPLPPPPPRRARRPRQREPFDILVCFFLTNRKSSFLSTALVLPLSVSLLRSSSFFLSISFVEYINSSFYPFFFLFASLYFSLSLFVLRSSLFIPVSRVFLFLLLERTRIFEFLFSACHARASDILYFVFFYSSYPLLIRLLIPLFDTIWSLATSRSSLSIILF